MAHGVVETMHYGTNQKFGGRGQDLGGLCPLPQPKTATGFYIHETASHFVQRIKCYFRHIHYLLKYLPGDRKRSSEASEVCIARRTELVHEEAHLFCRVRSNPFLNEFTVADPSIPAVDNTFREEMMSQI